MEAIFFTEKKTKIARMRINTRKTCHAHPKHASPMAFEPYARENPRSTIRVRRSTTRRVRMASPVQIAPMSLTKRVQVSFGRRREEYAAFKIIPRSRLPPYILSNLDVTFEWGAQLIFTGGILGSVVVEDLARRTPFDGVLHTSWDMPALEEGETLMLYSVMVRSTGDAEQFEPDGLLALHAPELAERTRGAHVFHFFDEGDSMQFQSLLLSRILEVRD